MTKLDKLISYVNLTTTVETEPFDSAVLPVRFKEELLEVLNEIKDETFKTDKPTKKQRLQSRRLADELLLPLNFGDWALTTYDISATVEEPPTLTAEYRFIQGTEK